MKEYGAMRATGMSVRQLDRMISGDATTRLSVLGCHRAGEAD